MRWVRKDGDGWHWWFAVIPKRVRIEGGYQWFWLEWYRCRFCGTHYEIELPGHNP